SSPWSALVTVSMVLIGMRASRALQSGSRTVLRPSVASVCAGAGRRSIVSETVAHAHDAAVLRVMADGETEIAAHGEHLLVLGEDDALDAREALRSGIADHVMQQGPANAASLQVGANKQAVFGHLAIGIG